MVSTFVVQFPVIHKDCLIIKMIHSIKKVGFFQQINSGKLQDD